MSPRRTAAGPWRESHGAFRTWRRVNRPIDALFGVRRLWCWFTGHRWDTSDEDFARGINRWCEKCWHMEPAKVPLRRQEQ